MSRKSPTPSPQSRLNNIIFTLVLIGLAIWLFANYSGDPAAPPQVRGTAIATVTRTVRGTANAVATATTAALPAAIDDYPPMPLDLEEGRVVDVVDGDTLDVQLDSGVERVRLIGLNAPESVDPRRPVQCFGVEASAFTQGLTLEQTVYLEEDLSQGSRDQFDRLLRYVWLADGRMVNLELIAGGYAAQYTFDNPYAYRDLFRDAERAARDGDAGLWSPQTCDGDFDARR